MKAAGIGRISISIDFPDAAEHDRFRGCPGAFDAALQGMRARPGRRHRDPGQLDHHAPERGLPAAPAGAGRGARRGELPPVHAGAHRARQRAGRPGARPRRLRARAQLDLRRAAHVAAVLQADRRAALLAGHAPAGQGRRRDARGTPPRPRRPRHAQPRLPGRRGLLLRLARRLWCSPAATSTRRPATCAEQSFGEIWRTAPLFADLRDLDALKGKCGACEYKRVCGGCRARAFERTGDYLAEEPYCAYVPRGWAPGA